MQNRTVPRYKKSRSPVSPVIPAVGESDTFIYCYIVT